MIKTLPAQMPAVLYGRVSTDKQDLERQDRMLSEYCTRMHMVPVLSLNDPDTSGSIPFAERAGGRQVIAEIQRRSTQGPLAVVTTEQDRIGRDTVDIISTIRVIWELGATPHFTAEGGAVPRTPENEMHMGLRASIAQYERDKIRQRIRSKFATKRACRELCGTVSYGWKAKYHFSDGFEVLVDKCFSAGEGKMRDDALINLVYEHGPLLSQTLVDCPEEQKWILYMAQMRKDGWGFHSIAKVLNEQGVPTKRGQGEVMSLRNQVGEAEASSRRFTTGKWQCGNVSNVLRSKTVQAWLEAQCAARVAQEAVGEAQKTA